MQSQSLKNKGNRRGSEFYINTNKSNTSSGILKQECTQDAILAINWDAFGVVEYV